jgi:hypothetical protein
MSPTDFHYAYHTQSPNSSAKMALCIDEFYHNYQEYFSQESFNWNQMKDMVMYTTYDAFLFIDNSYYFQMFKKIINDLIPTGIMNHLIEYHYTKKFNFVKVEKQPQVLIVNDLLFGFKIWLGSCLTSFIVFIIEIFFKCCRTIQGPRKYAKVYPLTDKNDFPNKTLKTELIQKFRVKPSAVDIDQISVINVDSVSDYNE